jgi:hypothetical protein
MNVMHEVARLEGLSVKQLRERYAEAFGEATRANNKPWLVKRIAWRLQANAEGGLSDRAKRRAAELANEADLRLSPPKPRANNAANTLTVEVASPPMPDRRLPPPGTMLQREYKGQVLRVLVQPHGFEHDGTIYRTLSAVAKAITGSHVNGYAFFRLAEGAGQ